MTGQHREPEPQTVWVWTIDVPAENGKPEAYRLHDTARWVGGTALELAQTLAVQLDGQPLAYWRIHIFARGDLDRTKDLTYTSADHAEWLASPAGREELRGLRERARSASTEILNNWSSGDSPHLAIARAMANATPAPIDVSAELMNEADALAAHPDDRDLDEPPALVAWAPRLSHALQHFERLMKDDGSPDVAAVLAETGHMLLRALHGVLAHAELEHGDEDWTVCHESAELVAKICSTFVSAYLADQLGS